MDVYAVLKEMTTEILDEAVNTLQTAHFAHYESWGDELTRESLGDLYEHIMISLHHRDLAHIIRHCEDLATQRFNAGFDLVEVQTTFNALEQTMWRCWVAAAPAPEVAQGVGVLSSVLGAGKDAAARTYVRLASHRHAPAIDIEALAGGTV
jgi:hypothetical protein